MLIFAKLNILTMQIIKKISLLVAVLTFGITASAQIFYKIEGKGLEKPSYIFGTHHLAPLSIVDKYDINNYLDQVDQIVGELDLTQDQMALAMEMQPFMMAPSDSTLSKVIAPEDYTVISEQFKNYSPIPGIELSMFELMKPMVVETNAMVGIMSKLIPDYDPNHQLDTYFMVEGQEEGKKIVGLETPAFQAEMLFSKTPISVQAQDLLDLLKDPEKSIAEMEKVNDAYNREDTKALLELSEAEESNPEFMIMILDNRNAEWLKKLPGIIAEAPSFIAVGALHLVGENGVVEGLKKQGYTVTPFAPVEKSKNADSNDY